MYDKTMQIMEGELKSKNYLLMGEQESQLLYFNSEKPNFFERMLTDLDVPLVVKLDTSKPIVKLIGPQYLIFAISRKIIKEKSISVTLDVDLLTK